jgi:retinol dehydrogenase 12
MEVPAFLTMASLCFWNPYTLSLQPDSPIPFVCRQTFARDPELPNDVIDLQGQTVLITGANSGVGLETARKCVEFGVKRVIFGVRNLAKGEAAKKDVLAGKNHQQTQIDVWHLDMESFESIMDFGKKVEEEFREDGSERLDYAILNAGVWNYKYYPAQTGYEMSLQVCCSRSSAPHGHGCQ